MIGIPPSKAVEIQKIIKKHEKLFLRERRRGKDGDRYIERN